MHEENDSFIFGATPYETSPVLCIGDYGGAGVVGAANIRVIEEMIAEEAKRGDLEGLKPRIQTAVVRLCSSELRHIREHTEERKRKRPFISVLSDERARAVVAALRKRPMAILEIGDHGFRQLWINRLWEEGADTLDALSDYPAIDDEAVSETETEWMWRDFDDYGADDILKKVEDGDCDVSISDFLQCAPDSLATALKRSAMAHAMRDCSGDMVTYEHASTCFHAENIAPAFGDYLRDWIKGDIAAFHEMHAAELVRGQLALDLGEDIPAHPYSEADYDAAWTAYYVAVEEHYRCPMGLHPDHEERVEKAFSIRASKAFRAPLQEAA